MRDIPQELFMILIFGAIWLGQFLYSLLRRMVATMRAETASGTVIQSMPDHVNVGPTPVQADTADAPVPVATPQAKPNTVAARALSSARPHPRRFSRRGLMPDQRAVQDAIVIAAVLQPCHAHQPHDVG